MAGSRLPFLPELAYGAEPAILEAHGRGRDRGASIE
jgi:hypothetical protein